MDDNDFESAVTFAFRLTDGSPLVVSTGAYFKTHFGELFRSVRAKHGRVEIIGFDARPMDHPEVVAESTELRQRIHAARLTRA